MKKIISIAALALSAVMLTACGNAKTTNTTKAAPTPTAAAKTAAVKFTGEVDPGLLAKKDNITIKLQNGKEIKAELYPDLAPITVQNFEGLAIGHYYDGLIFHRVIPGFMIQGGGYDTNMRQKTSSSSKVNDTETKELTIKGEFAANGVENNLKHTRGVLSMARTNDPNSATSQFFIMHADAPHLDGQYAAFGKVTEGLEVVDEIAGTQTTTSGGMSDVPVTPIVIDTITVEK
jgi:peptidyl-prolyl cis-trans isomerase B (cyclophilin B)